MDDNITGFSPEEAISQINTFYNVFWFETGIEFWETIDAFQDILERTWCSPNAVTFSEKYFPRMKALVRKMEAVASVICRNAVDAYNFMAQSNGLSAISSTTSSDDWPDFAREFNGTLDLDTIAADEDLFWTPLKEASPAGIVGMNHAQVIQARNELMNKTKLYMGKIDNIPIDIAFYDPNGEMRESYKSMVRNFIQEVNSEMASITSEIDAALQTEEDRIELAKENAVNTMAA